MSRLSLKSIVRDEAVRGFLQRLVRDFIDLADWSARLDFLATYMAEQLDGGLLAKELEQMLNLQVGLSKNLEAADIQVRHPGPNFQIQIQIQIQNLFYFDK